MQWQKVQCQKGITVRKTNATDLYSKRSEIRDLYTVCVLHVICVLCVCECAGLCLQFNLATGTHTHIQYTWFQKLMLFPQYNGSRTFDSLYDVCISYYILWILFVTYGFVCFFTSFLFDFLDPSGVTWCHWKKRPSCSCLGLPWNLNFIAFHVHSFPTLQARREAVLEAYCEEHLSALQIIPRISCDFDESERNKTKFSAQWNLQNRVESSAEP